MASALQCPACGHKHRLSELNGDPIFSCEECGRLLKTPVEYRRPEVSAPVETVRTNGRVERGGAATRDQTSVQRVAAAPAPRSNASGQTPVTPPPARARRGSPRPPATLTLPLMFLGWIVALLLGGIVVRILAKMTGLFTGDSVIDLITGSGIGRFFRLFAIVPFWALATAGFMTLFVEGGRRWTAHRQANPPGSRPVKEPTKKLAKVPPAKRPTGPNPRVRPAPDPVAAPAPSSAGVAAESRPPADSGAPRARRIPKRDISSS